MAGSASGDWGAQARSAGPVASDPAPAPPAGQPPSHRRGHDERDEPEREQDRQPDDPEPDTRGREALEHLDEARRRTVDLAPGIELLLRRDHGRLRLEPEPDGQRGERRLLLEVLLLGGRLLDLAADGGQLGLDGEDVADLRRLGHDLLEGLLGRLEVGDPRPRSTTWPVTSSVPVRSVTTLIARARSAASASSHLSAGIRYVIVAVTSSPSPNCSEPLT